MEDEEVLERVETEDELVVAFELCFDLEEPLELVVMVEDEVPLTPDDTIDPRPFINPLCDKEPKEGGNGRFPKPREP